LRTVLSRMPGVLPVPVIVVQHMPAGFVESFARRLDLDCELEVRLAEHSKPLLGGIIWVAPGGHHLKPVLKNGQLYAELSSADVPGLLHKPSVDVTFQALAQAMKGRVLAAVLTGMGRDGASGAKALHEQGATIIAQNEETCVVYGMPRSVIEEGSADMVLPLEEIGDTLVALAWKSGKGGNQPGA